MKNKLLILGISAATLGMTAAFPAEEDNAEYRQGYGLILEQQWSDAQAFFTQFQESWPASNWVDDAAFWSCYAGEQSSTQAAANFECYERFLANSPDSSWASDARSKLLVLGTQLASRGSPEYLERLDFSAGDRDYDFDFDFDFDGDDIEDSIAEAMDSAQRELERVRVVTRNIELPDLPDLPELIDERNIRSNIERLRERQVEAQRYVTEFTRENRRSRNTADDELLSILAALRNDSRASEILIQRLDSSDSAELRGRIVLLLEDIRGADVTNKLVELLQNDESDIVRNNAVLVLIDRDEPSTRETLLAIARDSDYSPGIRAEILGELDDWDEAQAIDTLAAILRDETDPALVDAAADGLSDIGNEAALAVLMESFEEIDDMQLRRIVLDEISDIETQDVLNFLSEIAIESNDEELAAIAIEGIADQENNFAVAALEHVYLNTPQTRRRLTAVYGIGNTETLQAVEVLEQLLIDEENVEIKGAIARALGDTEQGAAVPVLMDVYRSNADAGVKREAIRGLRRLDEYASATDGLLEILEARLAEEGL